jgi:CubicO group peptidase (beta-lactamase class C family)
MSKMIAAATIESLAQDGMIDTSQPVTAYSPDLVLSAPFQASSVKIEHLLSHTSGLPDAAPVGCVQTTLPQWFSTPRPLWSAPGTIWDYSNTGFAAAGMVVEKITGQPYADVVKSRVFGPAGMTTATFDATAAMTSDHASGTVLLNGGAMNVIDFNNVHCVFDGPPGGVIASVVDYAHFIETMLANGGTMLHSDRVAAMETGYISTHDAPSRTYAFGLFKQDWVAGQSLYWHDGSLPGYHSELGWLPSDDVGVVVMSNGDPTTGDAPDSVMVQGLVLFGRAPTPTQWTTPPSDWTLYPGTYVDPYGRLGTVTVTLVGSTLSATSTGLNVSGAMQQAATDKWSVPGTALQGTFWRNGGGTPGFFVTRVGVAVRQ